jgi:hypothetical protein
MGISECKYRNADTLVQVGVCVISLRSANNGECSLKKQKHEKHENSCYD